MAFPFVNVVVPKINLNKLAQILPRLQDAQNTKRIAQLIMDSYSNITIGTIFYHNPL